MMKLKKELKGWGGLDYVRLTDMPGELTEGGEALLDAKVLQKAEKRILEEILLKNIPLRGLEVAFMRKALGMSRREFAREIQLSDVAVLKWEREEDKRLLPSTEIMIRAYFSKCLAIPLERVLTPLFIEAETPKELKVSYRSRSKRAAA
jgi:DNA-binding transcriptional regulator YiaG